MSLIKNLNLIPEDVIKYCIYPYLYDTRNEYKKNADKLNELFKE